MPKRIYQSEFCNVCRHNPVCNSTSCNDFAALDDCRCDELQDRIDNALKFAEDIEVQEIIDALNGKIKYPKKAMDLIKEVTKPGRAVDRAQHERV